jgi:hypothetical protein
MAGSNLHSPMSTWTHQTLTSSVVYVGQFPSPYTFRVPFTLSLISLQDAFRRANHK